MNLPSNNKNNAIKLLAVIMMMVAVMSFVWIVATNSTPRNPVLENPPNGDFDFQMPLEDIGKRVLNSDIILPAGKLIVTRMRAHYENGTMRLVVPKLELDTPVGGDTTLETIGRYPGLYKYAQIPNAYNTNVSIAGHRDMPQFEFYSLDTLTEGDYIYLIYRNKLFKYEYRSTSVVESTDWNPIRVYYDSRVTLTTCTPLGTSLQRMIVVGELIEIDDYSGAYVFS